MFSVVYMIQSKKLFQYDTMFAIIILVIDRLLADNLQDAPLLLVRPGNPDDLLLGVPILRGHTYP